jgi:phenylalanyl-tRNA synthetase alpha chain
MATDTNIKSDLPDQSSTQLQKMLVEARSTIDHAESLEEIANQRVKYLGRKSLVQTLSKTMGSLEPDQRRTLGQHINQTKQALSEILDTREQALYSQTTVDTSVDTSLPGKRPSLGHLHPSTQVMRSINSFFNYLGYSVYEGPEIETNEYNFDKLNLPLDHPARELADTFYIQEPQYLLRTHTSSVETRAMSTRELPLRIVVPGKVYRNETTNTTNNAMFYQYEGLVVDKNLSMADLKGTLQEFAKFLYGQDVKTRFRCKYYPQVEPGAGMDIQCTFCQGEGCQVCKYRGWIEVLGAGMVHPNALRACGIDPYEWSGFAFGMGFDRLVMLKYGINDVRKLYNGELIVEEKI